MNKEDIINKVYEDPLFKSLTKDLSEEERQKIAASLNVFVGTVLQPMVESFERLKENPELLKRQPGNDEDVVLKK